MDNPKFKKQVDNFVRYTLRKASLRWPARSAAFKRSRIERGLYKCEVCLGEFRSKNIQLDHIVPVVDYRGFTTWDDFIYRLFVPSDGFQTICLNCHAAKTSVENAVRNSIDKLDKKD
jgi:5-methylcytosine-specific restriction endonuclease McrA